MYKSKYRKNLKIPKLLQFGVICRMIFPTGINQCSKPSHIILRNIIFQKVVQKTERYLTPTLSVLLPTYTACTSVKQKPDLPSLLCLGHSTVFKPEDKVLRRLHRIWEFLNPETKESNPTIEYVCTASCLSISPNPVTEHTEPYKKKTRVLLSCDLSKPCLAI